MSEYGFPSPLNAQTLFDKIGIHLLHQGRQSLGRFNCAYRGEERRACAVGCVIPDSAYTPSIENVAVDGVLDAVPELAALRPFALLLRDLQIIHDDIDNATYDGRFYMTRLVRNLEVVAGHYGLSTEALRHADTVRHLRDAGVILHYTPPTQADPLPEPMDA